MTQDSLISRKKRNYESNNYTFFLLPYEGMRELCGFLCILYLINYNEEFMTLVYVGKHNETDSKALDCVG